MSSQVTKPRFGELSLPDRLPDTSVSLSGPPTRIGFLVLILAFLFAGLWGGLGVWAAVSKIQSAVVANGSIRVDGNLPVVQHLEGGLVREILVTEGARVEKGQVVAVLADTMTNSQDRILVNQLVNTLAQEARLEAEFRDADHMELGDELTRLLAIDPVFTDLVETQREIFTTNAEMWRGQAAILQERNDELSEQLTGLSARRDSLRDRLKIVQEELVDLEGLFEKGLVTKPRYTSRRENEVTLLGEVTYLESQTDGIRQRIAETDERILQVRRERALRTSSERQQVKERIYEIRQRIVANEDVRERSLVRAPVAGRVIGLKFSAPGEVIKQGEELLQIVPDGATFIVEGQVRPADIDQVAEGATARIRLTAYNFRTTPAVDGEVVYLSADALNDRDSGQPYYMVKIRIPDENLAALPGVEIQPGMPAQIMIATGEQTVANYVLGPLLAGLDTALREGD